MSAISPKQSLQNYVLATLDRSTTSTVLDVYEDGLKMVLKGCCGMEQQIQEYLTHLVPKSGNLSISKISAPSLLLYYLLMLFRQGMKCYSHVFVRV